MFYFICCPFPHSSLLPTVTSLCSIPYIQRLNYPFLSGYVMNCHYSYSATCSVCLQQCPPLAKASNVMWCLLNTVVSIHQCCQFYFITRKHSLQPPSTLQGTVLLVLGITVNSELPSTKQKNIYTL